MLSSPIVPVTGDKVRYIRNYMFPFLYQHSWYKFCNLPILEEPVSARRLRFCTSADIKKETWNFVYIAPCHRWLVQWGKTALTMFVKTERKMYAYCFKTSFWENGLADFGCPKRIRCVSARRIYVLLTVLPDFLLITGLRQFFSESAFVNNIPPPPMEYTIFFARQLFRRVHL